MLAAGCRSLSTLFESSGIKTGERRLLFSEEASRRAVETASTEDCFGSEGGCELGRGRGRLDLRLDEDDGGNRLVVLRGKYGCDSLFRA